MPNYRRTTFSGFIAIFSQAIVTNLTAILFVIIVGVNFCAQLTADLSFSGVIDRIGYRRIILPTTLLAFLGLVFFGLTPWICPNHIYTGLLISTVVFAFSSGLLEIIISPMVAAIPGNETGPAMSLMHSGYSWGQVITIVVTTLFLFVFDHRYWPFIVFFWALVPLCDFFLFLRSPLPETVPAEKRQPHRNILKNGFYLLTLAAIALGGASEVIMNQWSSTFMESALKLPKITGDLLGMCGFAVMQGIGRTLYGIFGSKINMNKVLILGSLTAVICYVGVALAPSSWLCVFFCAVCGLATALLWPGTIVLASERFPTAGAWMFALLAFFGDSGAAGGPWLTGEVVDASPKWAFAQRLAEWLGISAEQGGLRVGILIAAVFPLLALAVHLLLARRTRRETKR